MFRYNLSQMGCNVDVKLFQGFQIYVAAGQKGADFDAAVIGWNQDYPDPYDFLDVLLNGNNIHDNNNNNLAYFNNASDQPEARPGEQARRRGSLQGVRRPRSRDHQEVRAVGVLRQPELARVHVGQRWAATSSSRPTRALT